MKTSLFLFLSLSLLAGFILGCKDSESTSTASQLVKCETLLNEKEWDDAITTCGDVGTDQGYRYAANAYMGRAGLNMISLAGDLNNSSGDNTAKILGYVPDTTSDQTDYASAITTIMTKVETKDNSAWLEVTLISTLLIFKELVDRFDVAVDSSGNTTVCGGDSSNCDLRLFDGGADSTGNALDPTYDVVASAFYTGICGDSSQDNSYVYPKRCTIQAGSILDYNNTASSELTDLGDFSNFNLYTKINNGSDVTYDAPCGNVDDLSTDTIVTECELVYYLQNPSF